MDNKSSIISNDKFQMKRKRDVSKTMQCNSKNSCESSLSSFTKSPEDVKSLIDNFEKNKTMRVTRLSLKKFKEVNARSCVDSSRNNTIIINDSDNESNSTDKADSSICIIEHKQNTERISQLQQSQLFTKSKMQLKNPFRPRKRMVLVDNDLTCIDLNTQETTHDERNIEGENIAPSQMEDEVVELWSCLEGTSKTKQQASKQPKHQANNFTVDPRPNIRNLDYIRRDTSPVRKKRKILYSPIKVTPRVNRPIWQADGKKKQRAQLNTQLNTNSNSKHKLREIVVDGCNVAMAHTNGRKFSQKGIELIINYFQQRGHVVKVFLPQHVRKNNYQLLEELYRNGTIIFTPSRYIDGKQITPYDDRYILSYATKCGGIVISSDQFRDLYKEKAEWRDTIRNRLLAPTFVGDYVMFPEDPLGKSGPDLDTFLQH